MRPTNIIRIVPICTLLLFPGYSGRFEKMNTKQLIEKSVSLSVEKLALMVDSLLLSLNQTESETDKKWSAEAKRCLAELRSGQEQAISGDQVFSEEWKNFES